MKIIPAIDLIDGKCVRLSKGDFSQQKTYAEDPVEVAKMFEQAGLAYLHLVDLDGARRGEMVNHRVLEKIALATKLCIDYSGGLSTSEHVQAAFDLGASKVTLGSLANRNQDLFLDILHQFGPDQIILGADTRKGKLMVKGWTQSTEASILGYIESFINLGVQQVMCTDVEQDGMLNGPSFQLYGELLKIPHIKLIASGGVSSLEDLLVLKALGCDGAIVGKAIFEEKISLEKLVALC